MLAAIEFEQVYLKNIKALCQQFVNSCRECFKSKPVKRQKGVEKPIIPTKVLERFQMDFIELMEDSSGFKYILTLIDCYSKRAWLRRLII